LGVLYRQPFSPLLPSSIDNFPALLRGHPFEKPMGPGTLDFTWLICSFHASFPYIIAIYLYSKA